MASMGYVCTSTASVPLEPPLRPTSICKLLIVGNAKCGKSSIIRRYVEDSFAPVGKRRERGEMGQVKVFCLTSGGVVGDKCDGAGVHEYHWSRLHQERHPDCRWKSCTLASEYVVIDCLTLNGCQCWW